MPFSPNLLSFTLLFPGTNEEQAFKTFHDKIHLRVLRFPLILMAILCLPVALLQSDPLEVIIVFVFVCGPCFSLFLITFSPYYSRKKILTFVFLFSAELLMWSFPWMLRIDATIVFYFVLHFIHLTAFLRFYYGCCFSIFFHITKIACDFSYHCFHKDIFPDWRSLIAETLIEIIAHCCFIFIAYKNESTARSFFRLRNEINFEKEESEKLLLNTLPQQAIERLEQGEFPVSDRWEDAAIVSIEVAFSDKVLPSETSVLLSETLYLLDDLSTQYGLEKLLGFRGDEYVVMSTHEKSCYTCATFSFAAMRQLREYLLGWESNQSFTGLFTIKIGIACSTIYGGVVGSEKCTYDYWGDGLMLVQKMASACPANSIVVSSKVQKTLAKHGAFSFCPIDSVLVPPLGQVELFTLTDPSEETQDFDSKTYTRVNISKDIFSSKRSTLKHPMNYDFDPTTPLLEARLTLNKYTLRFDDPDQERMVVRQNAESSLWQIRIFMAVWVILSILDSVKGTENFSYWNRLVILGPVIAVFIFCTFSRKFVDYSEFPLLLLSIMMSVQYLYFAYQSPFNLLFLLYPLFVFYLLPLCYTHAACTATATFLGYAIIICAMTPTQAVHFSIKNKVQQVIMLVVVIITYNVAAYHMRERMRRLYIFTDSLSVSKQKVEQRLRVIIPARIISLLRQGQYPIVYNFQDIGIGCIVITNMQALTKEYSYNQIALMLHNFHQCSDKATTPGLDKIKTIGPIGMVAGGLPTGMHEEVDYMHMLGRWALGVMAMLNSASKENLLKPCTPTFCVVLHFGEVFAGIAGSKKYRFDLWGASMAKLQRTLEAAKTLDQNAVYVTEEAREVLGKNFVYKLKTIIGESQIFQIVSEAKG
eukprot:Phypoly_transcript_01823.p1 GENE.Phypoly_transcript_01823~~Phypoly_transcript_01823.p1  ORF type:complete len:871 (+),score=108.07 Phypoly_transcript_01823:479-3091(+)